MIKPIKLDLEYPDITSLDKDKGSAIIIGSAYGSGEGELRAILQYTYHALHFSRCNLPEFSEKITGIAIAEMEHLQMLGTALIKLGADPIFTNRTFDRYNFFSSGSVSYTCSPEQMLLDDISGELSAIAGYEEMLSHLKNEKVSAMIMRIKLDEELHLNVLKNMYNKLKDKCYEKNNFV